MRLLVAVIAVALIAPAFAQGGKHGSGHELWHESSYSKLIRNDTKTSCCTLADCRPTQSRMVGASYEILVDSE